MIDFDTNVFVRYLGQDEPRRTALPNALIEQTLSSGASAAKSGAASIE